MKHGGARSGSGRKDLKVRERVNFTLPQALIHKLRRESNMSETVELALMRYFKQLELDTHLNQVDLN